MPELAPEQQMNIAVKSVMGREINGSALERGVGEKVRETLETRGYQPALEQLSDETRPDPREASATLLGKFGINRDPAGEKNRTGDELTRFNDATEASTRVLDFLRAGYDRLENDDEQEKVRKFVETTFLTTPVLQDEFKDMPEEERTARIEKLLRSASFTDKLKDRFLNIAGRESDFKSELEIVQAQGETELAVHERDTAQKNLTDLESATPRDEAAIATAKKDHIAAKNDTLKQQIEYHDMRDFRAQQEKAVVEDLKDIFTESARQTLVADLKHSFEEAANAAPGAKEQMVSEALNATRQAMEARWTKTVQRRRGLFRQYEDTPVLDTIGVSRDYQQLLKEGPAGVLRQVLQETTSPEGHTYTKDEIEDLLNNEQFSSAITEATTEQLLTRRLLTRKMRTPEVYRFIDSEWGRGMIEKAINNNTEFRQHIQNLTGSENVDIYDDLFRRRFAAEVKKKPGLLLFPLTTLPWVVTSAVRAGYTGARASVEDERAPHGRRLAA